MWFLLSRELVGRRSPAVVPEAVEADRSEEEAVVAARVAVEVPSAEEAVAADPSVEEVAEVDRLAVVVVVVEARLEVASSRECVYLFYALCWFDYRCLVFLTNRSSMCRGQTDHRCEEDKQIIGVKNKQIIAAQKAATPPGSSGPRSARTPPPRTDGATERQACASAGNRDRGCCGSASGYLGEPTAPDRSSHP